MTQGIKLKDKDLKISYLEKVNGVYYHVIPGTNSYPEKRKRIGDKQRNLKRYLKNNGLTNY